MYDRRWYDSNESTTRALEILKDMDDSQRRALSKDSFSLILISDICFSLPPLKQMLWVLINKNT